MPVYRCFIEGENFLLDIGDGPKRYGFFTTRWVRAKNNHDAELKCLSKLKAKGELGQKHLEDETDLAKISFPEIVEVPNRLFLRFGAGFTFFPMGEDEAKT